MAVSELQVWILHRVTNYNSPRSLRSLVCEVEYPHGNYPIHQFVLNNYKPSDSCSESDVRAALRAFPDEWVNAKNEDGLTALHLAVIKRNSFMVKMLLSCLPTIDVDAKWVKQNETDLHIAALAGYFKSAISNRFSKTLAESGAVIDIKDTRGKTLLHVAPAENQTDSTNVLTINEAELIINDTEGETSLHVAIKNKSGFEIVKLLVEYGANINEKSHLGYTPIHLAVNADLKDVIEYLISRNVDLNTVGEDGMTPLHSAVENISLKTVSDLAKYGANLNSVNNRGETPLHIAAKNNQIDMIKILVSNGAKLNIKDMKGDTPLHNAIHLSGLDTVKLLVESGADVNVKSNKGLTPLHLAVKMSGDFGDVIEYLIKSRNVDLNTVDKTHSTPLHFAAYSNLKTVSDLAKHGANLNLVNNLGETPLHIAAKNNQIDIVKVLTSNGADVNMKTKNLCGKTPLHEAVSNMYAEWDRNSCFKLAEVLVKSGAVVDVKDNYGETAISIAKRRNLTNIVEFLKGRVTVSAVDVNRDETSIPEAESSTTVTRQPPLKKRRTSETYDDHDC